MPDIKSISAICKKHGVLLIVDNAHGAYLEFLSEPMHPIKLGADICCDSAHKTLPVLTGGAYLHISPESAKLFADKAKKSLALFGSTSPSYLILQSLDAANKYIADGYREKLAEFIKAVIDIYLAEKTLIAVKVDSLRVYGTGITGKA
jgi:arginine/lysine/ornithine decarboxylase